jgi:type III pantothenate kinase
VSESRLLVDVGNSRVKFGLFTDGKNPDGLPKCWHSTTVDVRTAWPWSPILDWFDSENLPETQGYIAGSNPAEIARVKQSWPSDWPAPIELAYVEELFPLKVQLPEPRKAGMDRLLNAVAANVLRRPGQAVLIVDSGTATTVDAVNTEGAFLGGAILPGFDLCARALHHYTALLPLIPLEELGEQIPDCIGENTRAAMRSGLYWGQVGAVKEVLSQASQSLETLNLLVLVTGGGGAFLMRELPSALWLPHLSLQGLALVIESLDRQIP